MPLFCLLNKRISAKSTPQILSLNKEYTLCLLNFLITGLCNSSANLTLLSLIALTFFLFIFLTPVPTVFLSKKFYTILANPL